MARESHEGDAYVLSELRKRGQGGAGLLRKLRQQAARRFGFSLLDFPHSRSAYDRSGDVGTFLRVSVPGCLLALWSRCTCGEAGPHGYHTFLGARSRAWPSACAHAHRLAHVRIHRCFDLDSDAGCCSGSFSRSHSDPNIWCTREPVVPAPELRAPDFHRCRPAGRLHAAVCLSAPAGEWERLGGRFLTCPGAGRQPRQWDQGYLVDALCHRLSCG